MMMNRERIGFWVRLVSILLAAIFIISFVFLGVGTNIQYNVFDLFGNQNQQKKQQDQTPGPEQQIAAAEKDLKKDPKDPEKIKDLAGLYYNAGRYDDAIRVLQKGQKAVPDDEEIPAFLGQIYSQPGGPGLRTGRPARRGHKVLQRVPRPRSQGPGGGQGQRQDLRPSRRQGEHRQCAALTQARTEGV
jgi:tetratricopeptide (TPR) repeat protein